MDYYEVLQVSRSASPAEIKQAYHRALLIAHPDKHYSRPTPFALPPIDLDLIRLAYITLSSASLRAEYDKRAVQLNAASTGPRPAHILSLEELEEGTGNLSGTWSYPCRCGGQFRLCDEDMEKGQHFIGCGSCSEVVWVGYELAEE